MRICSTAEGLSVVSEREVLIMFITFDGEGTARNISERHKILCSGEMETKVREQI
jgi:hypothetical protein